MRIVHLLGWYFPDSVGGTEVYVEGLSRRLVDAGHEVFVAAPIAKRNPTHMTTHDGVSVFRYAIPDEPTRDEAYHRVPARGVEALYAWLANIRPDILHVHSFATSVGLAEIREARRLGIRVIATCHLPGLAYMCRTGELMQWGEFPCDGIVIPGKCASCNLKRLGMPKPLARVAGAMPVTMSQALRGVPGRIGTTLGMSASVVEYAQMQREMFELLAWFVVLNETSRRMLVSNGSPAEKLVVNRLGLSHRAITPKRGPDEQPTTAPVRFGYLGRLHPTKGLVELIRAARSVPVETPFALEIRGPVLDADTRVFVERLRALAAGDSRIVFEAAVPGAQVPQALAGLDALVVPSMWFENGPTVAIEAFAAGTPIIASRVGNLAELVEDGVSGQLIDAGDILGLARALGEAARNPTGTIDRWRRGIPAVRTMDDIARDYVKLYAA